MGAGREQDGEAGAGDGGGRGGEAAGAGPAAGDFWGRFSEWEGRLGFSKTLFAGPKAWKGALLDYRHDPLGFKNEVLSGLTVAIAQVPESVAFSFVAGVNPIVGLYATFFMGLITAQIGGRPGMVSGAAGAMAVVARVVMDPNGLFPENVLVERGEIQSCLGCASLRDQAYDKRKEYLFLVMWIVGIMQFLCGVLRLGSLVKLIPQTVMTGFVNGLATIIFMAQLESFQELDWRRSFNYFDTNRDGVLGIGEISAVFARDLPDLSAEQLATEMGKVVAEVDASGDGIVNFEEFRADKFHLIHDGHDEHKMWRTLSQDTTWIMLFYVFGSMLVVHFLPKLVIKGRKVGKLIPSSLVSILLCLLLEHALFRNVGLPTPTVKDMAPVKGGLPVFKLPDVKLDSQAFRIIMPTSVSLMAVGLIESILTLQLVDEILGDASDATGRCTQECIAQGLANLVSAMFQSMGGDAMIGQSTINVKSGGTGRLSTTFASVMFLIFIVAASSVIELVPVAALTGVLFMVVIYTFDWSCLSLMSGDLRAAWRERSFKQLPGCRCRLQDSFLIVLVSVVTVLTNLAIAVVIGVILAALMHSWEESTSLRLVRTQVHDDEKHYVFEGPLFFASDRAFKNYFEVADDPPRVVVDLTRVVMKDYSALAALNSLADRYQEQGKTLAVQTLESSNGSIVELFGSRLSNVELAFSDAPSKGVGLAAA